MNQAAIFDGRMHFSGSMWTMISNDGALGQNICYPFDTEHPDLTRLGVPCLSGCEFPGRSGHQYVSRLELLFGTVRDRFDTLVSANGGIQHEGLSSVAFYSSEFRSDRRLAEYSNLISSPRYSPDAHGEQEFHGDYNDTLRRTDIDPVKDFVDNRVHVPIGIQIRQKSYSWSDSFAKQFVIYQHWIVNISGKPIARPTVGVYLDPDIARGGVSVDGEPPRGDQYDDLCGYTRTAANPVTGLDDTLELYWAIDNDGDPASPTAWDQRSVRGAIAIRVLRRPKNSKLSYNWWATSVSGESYLLDWGPRKAAEAQGYAGGLGVPRGDRGRYRMMTNGEFDYPQLEAAQNKSGAGWARPLSFGHDAVDVANGLDSRFLVSFYGFADIAPGDSIPFDFALICGRNVHRDPAHFERQFDPNDSRRFMEGLDFSDLYDAARWAGWVYDTPGYDSDPNDGVDYKGEAYLVNCVAGVCDSLFYKGDGIPDLVTATSLPPPPLSVTTSPHKAVLRWNGALTETAVDRLSLKRDFEGYRVYIANTDREDDYALYASWDKVDYKRIAYQPRNGVWSQISDPMTVAQWQLFFGDESFDPLNYVRASFQHAYSDTVLDTTYSATGEVLGVSPRVRYSYWAPEGINQENEYETLAGLERNPIQRVAIRDTVINEETVSYGVYEVVLSDLNAAIPKYLAVTSFEYSDFESSLPPQETRPSNNTHFLIPIYSADAVVDSNLRVSVYPNPYKISYMDHFGNRASYHSEGYEVAELQDFREQDRRIWFINLPDTALIRIYSLDGDLIREIKHPDRHLTKYSSAVGWDLVSRNTQAVVSGIYIWRVDSRLGSQVGKIVIIK